MKPLFLQVKSDHPSYQGMIDDHKERHLAYCAKWDYDYVLDPNPITSGWDVQSRVLHYLKSEKHSHVFWIDADTFVADFSHDMRETLPEWSYLALTIHPYAWRAEQPVFHANTGVQYWRANDWAIAFNEHLLENASQYQDNQAAINWMLFGGPDSVRWQRGFRVLNCEFNNNYHDQPQRPILSAYHGYLEPPTRREVMKQVSQQYPWSME